jgi:hypothetical protein
VHARAPPLGRGGRGRWLVPAVVVLVVGVAALDGGGGGGSGSSSSSGGGGGSEREASGKDVGFVSVLLFGRGNMHTALAETVEIDVDQAAGQGALW